MDLYQDLQALIASVRRRWRKRAALRTMAHVCAAAAAPLGVAAFVERVLQPHGSVLIVIAAAAVGLALGAASLALRKMPPRPSDRQVARFIEERATASMAGELNDALVTAVDAAERGTARDAAFLPLMLRDAVVKLRAMSPADILPPAESRRVAWRALAAAALLVAALVASAPFLERAVATAWVRVFPGSVRLEVLPGDVRIRAGTPVRIRAVLRGPRGAVTRLVPDLSLSTSETDRSVAMAAAGDAFEFTVGAVDRTFSYAVTAGSSRSARYTVTALTPPRVERIDLHYEYPAFAGLAPREERDGGDVYAPAGTRVRVTIHTDKPIVSGELGLGHSPAIALRAAGAREAEAELVLAKNDSYRVRLADRDGLQSSGESEYFIRLMDDRPPDVRILRPSGDQQITPLEEVPVEARADDDYGIGKFELVYAISGRRERVVPFERLSGTEVQKVGTRLLLAEDLGVKPGDVITYYARARDIARGKRSTEATSDIFFLEVKPFNSEFVQAQSQAGSGGSEPQLESLIQAQKEIISSTWNVERRSQGGRSTEDVKTIAAAQAELKTRAEQQLSRTRRRPGRGIAPQRQVIAVPQSRSPTGDPVQSAVDAMAQALRELGSDRTKEALVHQMAALNGLLQAQAEERRRQVMQQANGAGSGGSNRTEQDMSALFDKELQRQQRTNYETRPSVESRPERSEAGDAALERIRELARRQEDLSRRQAELAEATLGTEEMKRQLERLTREQTELREEAERILRRSAEASASRRGRGDAPKGSGREARGSQSQGLQGAADQMRSAASDLRRDDPGAAAASGRRAAEQLRQLEKQSHAHGAAATAASQSPEAEQLTRQLDQARGMRERVQRAEQQLRAAEVRARGGAGRSGTAKGEQPAPGGARDGRGAAPGSPGRAGETPGGGTGSGSDVKRLRDEYQREVQRAQQALDRLAGGQPARGANGGTPEDEQFSRSAPGTEAFKQDRSGWESLRKNLDSALEEYEASISARLARTRAGDRFSLGGSDQVPDAYRPVIAKYFESLAKKKP
jgi:hypothetical protein